MASHEVVLVTGGTSGLGAATVAELVRRAHEVYAASRQAAASAPGAGTPIMLSMDVRDARSVETAIAHLLDREGRLDVLVNNAGVGLAGAVEDTSDDEAADVFETNFFGAHRVARAVLPVMRRQQRGLIVNVGSMAGEIAIPFQGFYSASKAALAALSHALRVETAPHGVAVTVLEPGDFRTAFTDHRRWTATSGTNPAYRHRGSRAVEVMEHDERGGADPEVFARHVAHLIERMRPRASYAIGMPLQRLALQAARFLPSSLRERLLRAHYDV